MIKIVDGYPPNFQEILAVFPEAKNKGVIFAFNDRIYNPTGASITPELMAHEAVHCERQGGTDESALDWWDKYLTDPKFCFNEELVAHQAEYAKAAETRNRNDRKIMLSKIAQRLSSSLYGNMVKKRDAQEMIKKGVKDER